MELRRHVLPPEESLALIAARRRPVLPAAQRESKQGHHIGAATKRTGHRKTSARTWQKWGQREGRGGCKTRGICRYFLPFPVLAPCLPPAQIPPPRALDSESLGSPTSPPTFPVPCACPQPYLTRSCLLTPPIVVTWHVHVHVAVRACRNVAECVVVYYCST